MRWDSPLVAVLGIIACYAVSYSAVRTALLQPWHGGEHALVFPGTILGHLAYAGFRPVSFLDQLITGVTVEVSVPPPAPPVPAPPPAPAAS